MKYIILITCMLLSSFAYAQHAHAKKGANGGYIVEVGKGIAKLEVIHNSKSGEMTIFVLDKDSKAMTVDNAPRINLNTLKGRKQIKSEAVKAGENGMASTFKAKSKLLKGGIRGAISIKLNNKSYTTSLPHAH